MIDRQINGTLYYDEERPPEITQLNCDYVTIKMYSAMNKNEITLLYKIVEDHGISIY